MFYHENGLNNISDKNSKIFANGDPVSTINSQEWRHGNENFCEPDFPGNESISEIQEWNMSHFKQPVITQCTCTGMLCQVNQVLTCKECQDNNEIIINDCQVFSEQLVASVVILKNWTCLNFKS